MLFGVDFEVDLCMEFLGEVKVFFDGFGGE